MARLSAESSPMLDRFLPTLSRSADFFVLWIGIAGALAASNDERGRRAAVRGLAGMVVASTASNVLGKGLVRRPRPAGEVRPDRRPGRTPITSRFRPDAAAAAAFATGVGLEMPALAAPVRGARGGRRRGPGRERGITRPTSPGDGCLAWASGC